MQEGQVPSVLLQRVFGFTRTDLVAVDFFGTAEAHGRPAISPQDLFWSIWLPVIVELPAHTRKEAFHPFPKGRPGVAFQAKDSAGRVVWRRTFTADELQALSFEIVIADRDRIDYAPSRT